MDCLTALTTRASPAVLAEPAPAGAVLDAMMKAALAAPDHGRLQPWKFILIRGQARARLGRLLAAALRRRRPDAADALLERERAKPLRAPLIVVVAATPKPSPGVPEIEQVVSAAAAAQNILLAAHALGFGGFWRTGAPAYDETVKAGLGLGVSDAIVGFLYLGSVARAAAPRAERLAAAHLIEEWTDDNG